MTVVMPAEIPLPLPKGDGYALIELARNLSATSRRMSDIDNRLLGPAAAAPGWLGADASAAAAQLAGVVALIRSAGDAMPSAAERLAAHAECLLLARRRIAALREEQDEQFREAYRRLARLPDLELQLRGAGSAAQAIVHEVEAGEASRSRRHAAVLEEVEDDASATARVLADSCVVVGGRGSSGDANRVIAYLAAQLPGWGDRELARRGRALAERLTEGGDVLDEGNRLAKDAAALANSTAFASAFLSSLGADGVRWLLRFLGANQLGSRPAIAQLLASAFGAAAPAEAPRGSLKAAIEAEYVDPEDGFETVSAVATGLAMVLSAGRSTPSSGVATPTVANWARQFLRWENTNHETIGTRFAHRPAEVGDPTGLAIGILAERASPEASAAFLDDPEIWKAALRRPYDDGGAALSHVIAQAGRESGARGDRVVLMGLATAGAGLAGGDPSAWTVNRDTLAGVAPGLGDAVSAHIDVAVGALQVGVDGHLPRSQPQVLAGLGLVTLDPGAAAAIETALGRWAQVQPHDLTGTSAAAPLPAIAVPSAYVAVQQYGQRLSYALDQCEAREAADLRRRFWTAATLPLVLISGPAGIAAGVVAGYLAIPLDMDGTWDAEPDRGRFFDSGDAADAASGGAATTGPDDQAVVADQARAAYARALVTLGIPRPPVSADADFGAPLRDAARGLLWGRITRNHPVVERVGAVADSLFG